jgi:hypothetical protein
MGKWEDMLRAVSGAAPATRYERAWEALDAISRSEGPIAGYANELLTMPRSAATLDGVDEFVRGHGAILGPPIARGRESIVFSAPPKSGGPENVLKIQLPGAGRGFSLPTGVDGVAGYWAQDRIGPGVLVALQPRAAQVLDSKVRSRLGGLSEEGRWVDMADAVQRSLAARGMQWTDPHSGNVGIMPDGNLAAIDGAVIPHSADDALPDSLRMGVEDAIRLLRPPARK